MYQHSKYYRLMGNRLIRTCEELKDIRDAKPKIAYLISDEEKKQNRKIVFGDCNLASPRYKWCCPYDFFIVIYAENVAIQGFNEEQKEILLRHELNHVGVDFEGNENKFYIIPHDVEDFYSIIGKYGIRWEERG